MCSCKQPTSSSRAEASRARTAFEVSLDSLPSELDFHLNHKNGEPGDSTTHHHYIAQGVTFPDFFDARLRNFFTLLQMYTSNHEIRRINKMTKEELRTGDSGGNTRSQFTTCHGEGDNFIECWLSREYYARYVQVG